MSRRSFLTRLTAGATAVGAAAFGTIPLARAAARWEPARHEKDDWLDQLPGKHRLVFDGLSPEGVRDALQFTGNFFTGNKNGYGLDAADVAVVIVMRHRATQFAFTDAIWAKF